MESSGNFFDKSVEDTLTYFNVKKDNGLTVKKVEENRVKYGKNILTKKKKQSFFGRLFTCLKEPMILILLFGLVLAFGSELGTALKTGKGDFSECYGILFAITLSVGITLIMEGSSERAFETLNRIYDNLTVNVIRDGKLTVVSQQEITVGDIVLMEAGDKIIADGRIIESKELKVNESALTGESQSVKKQTEKVSLFSPLAERTNCVYSGTFVVEGSGKMVVSAIGDNTEIGKIANELSDNAENDTPLSQKLNKLGKTISIIGIISAIIVFILSMIRLKFSGNLNFTSVRELFISCIVLIVAVVPEGLPTIVAVSLALNMIKLAKENALIKKMSATETAGAISVICTDKTGTLTQNKMTVKKICVKGYCYTKNNVSSAIENNIIYNSQVETVENKGKKEFIGSATEKALYEYIYKGSESVKEKEIINTVPFSSEKKYMITAVREEDKIVEYIKGAPEIILNKSNMDMHQKSEALKEIGVYLKQSSRVIAFGHTEYKGKEEFNTKEYVFDGYAVISDPVRKEVYKAVKDCKTAGIKVMMLTGDNIETATAIAKETGIYNNGKVVNASDIENMSDDAFKKILPTVTVIARSTPLVKLRVVKTLKSLGEVVAVTGDGINDAPAIKNADIGVSMGKSGSEITKEASDLVLLDDSFTTVVKAVAFGRNVYRNLQRFIMFQLSVNLSALIFITVVNALGYSSPFNTLQLLWINIIMDGPPAITLGLEPISEKLMTLPPVKRSDGIVSKKTFLRILFNGLYISTVLILEFFTDFLAFKGEQKGGIFTLFILFQLFNAFNCRELGSKSIFSGLSKNKIMVITFSGVFLLHIIIVNCFSKAFNCTPLSFMNLIKCVVVSCSIIIVSEIYKLIYRKKVKA